MSKAKRDEIARRLKQLDEAPAVGKSHEELDGGSWSEGRGHGIWDGLDSTVAHVRRGLHD